MPSPISLIHSPAQLLRQRSLNLDQMPNLQNKSYLLNTYEHRNDKGEGLKEELGFSLY